MKKTLILIFALIILAGYYFFIDEDGWQSKPKSSGYSATLPLDVYQGPTAPSEEITNVRIAVIGDYGDPPGSLADAVRGLIYSKLDGRPGDYIVTTGDNAYPNGSRESLEKANERYEKFIKNQAFFPTLGNHDWWEGYPNDLSLIYTVDRLPSSQFFSYLPGNQRYYSVVVGNGLLKIIVLSTDSREPEHRLQADFLYAELQSDEPYKFVFTHEPAYSSCDGKSSERSNFPYSQWGVYPTAVFSGHCHLYERLEVDGLTYFVQGAGGGGQTDKFGETHSGNKWSYNDQKGALFIFADETKAYIAFYSVDDFLVDDVTINAYSHTAIEEE